MPDNIFPDLTNGEFDIKYNQLKILPSDVRSRLFNQGVVRATSIGAPQTGTGGGDDTPIPPGNTGCKKIYVANLTQSGTSDPVASIFENTIGDIAWSRQDSGVYWGTLTGAFPAGFTWVILNNPLIEAMDPDAEFDGIRAARINDNTIAITTRNILPGNVNADDLLNDVSIEIRTYCQLQNEECEPIQDMSEFALPIGGPGVAYHYEIELNGTLPIILTVTDKPAWLTITIEDGNKLVFDGTPDTDGIVDISFTLANCDGDQDVSTTIEVVELGDFIIEHETEFIEEDSNRTQMFTLSFFTPTGSYIDWGDGTLELITGSGNLFLFHTYSGTGPYHQTFYFNSNYSIGVFNNFISSPDNFKSTFFSHSSNFTNFGVTLFLANVMAMADSFPPSYTNKSNIHITAHADSTETSFDFSGISSAITQLTIENFPLLDTVTGIPATVVAGYSFLNCPNLANVNSGGTLPTSIIQRLGVIGTPVSFGTLNLSVCNFAVFTGGFTTANFNAILIALDANGITGGVCVVQNPYGAQPPSGGGATAKTNLIGKGWTVTTD